MRFGKGCIILEKSTVVGGLSQSVFIDDGVFDLGGHSFHTPHNEVENLVKSLMGENWYEQKRDARVSVGDELIPYPFQYHFNQLKDKQIVNGCIGYIHDPAKVERSSNFEEWIKNRFGDGIANHFMLPYNRKLWASDLKEIAFEWVGERIATETSPRKTPSKTRTPLISDSQVGYPMHGGFGEIFIRMAKECHQIQFNQEVINISIKHQMVETTSGKNWAYNKIISTMPLPYLLQSIEGCPKDILDASDELKAVSLKIVMLLVKLKKNDVPHRIYIADSDIPAHKVAFNHTSSPHLLSQKYHAITCEVSYSDMKPAPNDEILITKMIDWLINQKLVYHHEDVKASKVIDIPLGYPVNTHKKNKIIKKINDYLKPLNIFSIGRFGGWEYLNSDGCIYQGISLADQLLKKHLNE